MRMMAKIMLPVESGNQAVKDGRLGKIIQGAAERWKPEAMYFADYEGQRTAFIVVDLPDSSDTIPFAEPFFMEMNANVEFIPVLNADDLRKGLAKGPSPRRSGKSHEQHRTG